MTSVEKSDLLKVNSHCLTPYHEAHNRAGTAGASLRLCLTLYVCLFVTGLRLKYAGLHIVYIPFWHMLLMMPSRWRSRSRAQRIEEDTRTSPEIWKTVNCSTKR